MQNSNFYAMIWLRFFVNFFCKYFQISFVSNFNIINFIASMNAINLSMVGNAVILILFLINIHPFMNFNGGEMKLLHNS